MIFETMACHKIEAFSIDNYYTDNLILNFMLNRDSESDFVRLDNITKQL